MRARLVFAAMLCFAPPTAHAVPPIHHWTLENGVRVYFVESRQLPMLELHAVFDAAASRDAAGKSGVACLTNRMVREGTAQLGADDVAQRFESLGAEFSSACERDMATVDLRTLTQRDLLGPALDLFAQVITVPSFPEDALARERARALVALQHQAENPGSVIGKAFLKAVYNDHPYAQEPLGTEGGLKAITRTDLVAHHQRYYAGKNAWLAIVGDASVSDAKKIAQRVLGGLPAGAAAAPILPVPEIPAARREFIAFPASQSHLRLGQPGLTRNDPDYFPLYVGNYILGGGGLVSRLSLEVREKRGLSYSVYSYFSPMRMRGPFIIGLQTENSQRQEALKIVRDVLADFVANGPTEQELTGAKKHLTGGFPLRLDSNRKIADNLAVIGFYGLPLTYLNDFIPRVEAVTVGQIRDAFARRVNPDKMVTLILGGA